MSKLPNHTLWARAATTSTAASSSSRASTVFAKSQHHASAGTTNASSSLPRQRLPASASSSSSSSIGSYPASNVPAHLDAAALAAMGAITAPFQGPQPAVVVNVFEQQQQQQEHSQQTQDTATLSVSSISLPSLTSVSQSLLSSPALRILNHPGAMYSPRPLRPMHQWTQGQQRLQKMEANLSRKALDHVPTSMKPDKGKTRLLFDVMDSTMHDTAKKRRDKRLMNSNKDAEAAEQMERINQLLSSLTSNTADESDRGDVLSSHGTPPNGRRSINYKHPMISKNEGSISFTSTNPFLFQESSYLAPDSDTAVYSKISSHSSPSQSRSPSPRDRASSGNSSGVGFHAPFGSVSEPPAKFAVTTSAQGHVTSPSTGDGTSAKASELQLVASTSSASQATGSSGALPPQASAPAGTTDRWAKTFNIPRSAKRHDFMFEHGAYGIPKRHPLSSIRSSPPSSAKSGSERASPSRDEVPSSKVKAAADILAVAADFFAGSQRGASNRNEYTPFKSNDALQAALAGGSTAQEYELRPPSAKVGENGEGENSRASNGLHRMAIRGSDGRIIKERLRSVQVGEDAYFLRPDAMGVADGVGGWASRPGADPALFSRLLMHFCAVELSRYDGLSASELAADNGSLLKAWASVDPVEVMHRAWERCVRASRREGILGSSTAILGLLRGDELRIANMGDCVLMIIRRGEMMFRSTEQQHSFNFPVQLGMMGDTTDTIKKHIMASQEPRERAAAEGEVTGASMEDYDAVEGEGTNNGESASSAPAERVESTSSSAVEPENSNGNEDDVEPEWDEPRRDAGRWTVRVEAGDIIVVGSDGLMDNLFDEDIIEEVLRFLPASIQADANDQSGGASSSAAAAAAIAESFSPQLVSEALCSRAKAVSEDSRAISSPFQQRAMEEGLNYVGGKHDDISVVVCLVGERDTLDLSDSGSESEPNGDTDASASNSDSENAPASSTPDPRKAKQKYLIK